MYLGKNTLQQSYSWQCYHSHKTLHTALSSAVVAVLGKIAFQGQFPYYEYWGKLPTPRTATAYNVTFASIKHLGILI